MARLRRKAEHRKEVWQGLELELGVGLVGSWTEEERGQGDWEISRVEASDHATVVVVVVVAAVVVVVVAAVAVAAAPVVAAAVAAVAAAAAPVVVAAFVVVVVAAVAAPVVVAAGVAVGKLTDHAVPRDGGHLLGLEDYG